MPRKFVVAVGMILALIAVYLLVWPVPVNPVAWQAPPAPGYVGPFSPHQPEAFNAHVRRFCVKRDAA